MAKLSKIIAQTCRLHNLKKSLKKATKDFPNIKEEIQKEINEVENWFKNKGIRIDDTDVLLIFNLANSED